MTADLLLWCVLGGIAGAPFGHLAALGLIRAYEWAGDRLFTSDARLIRVVFLPTIEGVV